MLKSLLRLFSGKAPETFPPTQAAPEELCVPFQAGQLAWSDFSLIAKVSGFVEPEGRAISIEVTVDRHFNEKVEALSTNLKMLTTPEDVNVFINECVKLWANALKALGSRPTRLALVDIRAHLEHTYQHLLGQKDN